MGSNILVNPIVLNKFDQIHTVFGSLKAIPRIPDLI